MKILSSIRALQGKTISFRDKHIVIVPTMGNLHAGHISLIKKARSLAGKNGLVIVTIFVNKIQFGPKEDLKKYPRTIKSDLNHCQKLNVDIVFTPKDQSMYNIKHSTFVMEEILSKRMEGNSRPSHFYGVTTVVAKLFNIIQPNTAVFGAKDWQQATIIMRMVNDLNFPVRIVVAPIIREKDGLAMSSRNSYLTSNERTEATILIETIRLAKHIIRNRKTSIPSNSLAKKLKKHIATRRLATLDYIEFFNPKTLVPVKQVQRGTHMALAVYLGKTRLIDNGRL
ncbi:MAG: pantoate--beta-alanine ligase [Verrucomicrobiota bacterium]|nr:pantoate--beta-alanine ligase [Verrucomicrobiota bacterium]